VTIDTYTTNITNTPSAVNANKPDNWQLNLNNQNQEISMERTPRKQIPECISVGFIARRCGVSNTTVLRWINTGQLPAFRLPGGHFRVERENFSVFLTRYNMPSDIKTSGSHP